MVLQFRLQTVPFGDEDRPRAIKPPLAASARSTTSAESHQTKLMEALKEELFALETERLEGVIAPEEYEKQKGALEIVLVRALQSGQSEESGGVMRAASYDSPG